MANKKIHASHVWSLGNKPTPYISNKYKAQYKHYPINLAIDLKIISYIKTSLQVTNTIILITRTASLQ